MRIRTRVLPTVLLTVLLAFGASARAQEGADPLEASQGKDPLLPCPDKWRDTILAPRGWEDQDRRTIANEFAAEKVQLGCIFSDTYTLGKPDATKPERNCGW